MAEGQFKIVVTQTGVVKTKNALDKLVVSAEKAEKAIAKVNALGGRGMSNVAKGARDATTQLTRLAVVAGSAFGVRELAKLVDGYTSVGNRLRYLSGSTQKAAVIQNELFESAQKTRTSFDLTAETYSRMSLATKTLGVSQRDVIDATQVLNETVALSGANSREAEAGIRQFTQALASGRLQGDEFRSVMENIPAVADLIAQSLGVQRGELYKLRKEGKLTSDVLFTSLLKYKDGVDKAFGETTPTITQSLDVLGNTFQKFINDILRDSGGFDALTSALQWIPEHQREIESAFAAIGAAIAAAGVVAAGPWLPFLTALAAATASGAWAIDKVRSADAGTTKITDDSLDAQIERDGWWEHRYDWWVDKASKILPDYKPGANGANPGNLPPAELARRKSIKAARDDARRAQKNGTFREGDFPELYNTPWDQGELGSFKEAPQQFPFQPFLDSNEASLYQRGAKTPPPPSADSMREWEQFLKKLQSLRDELDPVGAAVRDRKEDFDLLTKGMVEGKLSAFEYARGLLEIGKGHMEATGPVQALQDEIQKEIDISKIAYTEREATVELMKIEEDFQKRHIDFSEADRSKTEELVNARIKSRKALEEEADAISFMDGVLSKSQGPKDDLETSLAQIERAAKSGKYTFEEYAEARRRVQEEFMKATEEDTFIGKLNKEIKDMSTVVQEQAISAINRLGDAVANFVMTGKFQFADFASAVIADLTRVMAQQALLGLTKSAVGAFSGDGSTAVGVGQFLGYHATGGSYMIGGSGAPDSQLISARVSPGERVDILTKQQQEAQAAAMQGGGGQANIRIINVNDAKEAMAAQLESEHGERIILNILHKNGIR